MLVTCFRESKMYGSYVIVFAIFLAKFSGVFGVNFQLCCPYGHEYRTENKSCVPVQTKTRGYNMKILPTMFKNFKESRKINPNVFNLIDDPWCRNPDGVREMVPFDDTRYFLQENSTVVIPEEDLSFDKNLFCLGLLPGQENYVPIVCVTNVTDSDAMQYSKTIGKYFYILCYILYIIKINLKFGARDLVFEPVTSNI